MMRRARYLSRPQSTSAATPTKPSKMRPYILAMNQSAQARIPRATTIAATSMPSSRTIGTKISARVRMIANLSMPQVSAISFLRNSEEKAQDRISLRAANYLLRKLVGLFAIPSLKLVATVAGQLA